MGGDPAERAAVGTVKGVWRIAPEPKRARVQDVGLAQIVLVVNAQRVELNRIKRWWVE